MLSVRERTRIYLLGGSEELVEQIHQRMPGAGLHRLRDFEETDRVLSGGEESDVLRCLVWSLPMSNGIDVHRRLHSQGTVIPTIALIDADEAGQVSSSRICGTMFMVRPCPIEMVVDGIRSALEIDSSLEPTRRMRTMFGLQLSTLSSREAEVMELIVSGRNSKEIANDLFIATQTVLKHRTAILKKLGARNDVELTLKVRQHRDTPGCLKICRFDGPSVHSMNQRFVELAGRN